MNSKDEEPDDVTPVDFVWKRIEQWKWVFAFKYMGPCYEILELGETKCHEFLTKSALHREGVPILKNSDLKKKNYE